MALACGAAIIEGGTIQSVLQGLHRLLSPDWAGATGRHPGRRHAKALSSLSGGQAFIGWSMGWRSHAAFEQQRTSSLFRACDFSVADQQLTLTDTPHSGLTFREHAATIIVADGGGLHGGTVSSGPRSADLLLYSWLPARKWCCCRCRAVHGNAGEAARLRSRERPSHEAATAVRVVGRHG